MIKYNFRYVSTDNYELSYTSVKGEEKTIQNTHRQTHKICICIYTCPYKYT